MILTKKQRQVYDFIATFVQSHGYSPSFSEIAAGVGLSSLATVHKHVQNLQEKGMLKRSHNRGRTIEVSEPPFKPTVGVCPELAAEITKRVKAREQLKNAIAVGRLTPQPCEICGEEKTQGHHFDYDQPESVQWLCYRHHMQAHKDLRRAENTIQ